MRVTPAVLLLILLVGCAQQDALEIGGLFALTGAGSQFGEDELRGAQMAIEEINSKGGIDGSQMVLISEDTRTDFVSTLSAYNKLVEVDGVSYIIGPTWGPFASVIVPGLQEDGVIAISPSTGEESELYKDPNFFKTWGSDRLEIPVLIEDMKENGAQKVVIVTSTGSFEESMKHNFIEEASDLEIAGEHEVSPDENDFRSLLKKIEREDPDAIYIVLAGFDNVGQFFKQAYELNIDVSAYAWSGFENHEMLEKYHPYLENVYYPIPVMTQKDGEFSARFEERFGNAPLTPAAATSYDAVMMLAIAMDGSSSVQETRLALHEIQGYDGASSIMGFDEFGWATSEREYKVMTVRDGEFVEASGR